MHQFKKELLTQDLSVDYFVSSYVHVIKKPYLEQDILCLNDMFLTNGFHTIKVANVEVGRSIMQLFLQAASLYHNVACVTNWKNNSLPGQVCDINTLLFDI